MSEEIGELDLTAQANAAQTATDYVTSIGSTGIHIHPKNDIGLNYQKLTSEGIDIVADGRSVAKMGSESVSENNGTRKIGVVRVGNEAHGHIILNEGGMRYNQADQTMFAVEPVGDPVYTIAHTYASVTVEPYSSTGRAASFTSSGKVEVDYPLDYVVLWSADGGTTWKEALEQVGEMSTLSNTEVYFYTPSGIYGGSIDRTTATIDHRILNMTSSTITAAIAKVVDARPVRTIIGKPYDADGADNQSHVEMDYHSMKLISRENSEYFYVSDLRGANGEATIVQPFTGDGYTKTFGLYNVATDTTYSVVVSDNSGGTISKTTTAVTFQTAPTAGATITVTYNTTDQTAIAFTFGRRKAGTFVGPVSFSEGYNTEASAICTHAEGHSTKATMSYAHAEGFETTASGYYSHSEGYGTTASGGLYETEYMGEIVGGTHAEGRDTTASGAASHSEGRGATASGHYSHAEGLNTIASGEASHAEGAGATASGAYSHAEGHGTASGLNAHAEGFETLASGDESHAQNSFTIASKRAQTALGTFNIEDTAITTTHPSGTTSYGEHALIIGNGTGQANRSNAATIGWDGNYLGQAMAGIIQMFAGATPPSGWLVCDGSAVSRTTYATLFAAIGTTWGAGDGSTTFNLPDLRGRTPIGAGTGTGLTARTLGTHNIGAETHKLTAAESGNQAQTVTSAAGTSHSHGANGDKYFVTTSTDEAISRTNIKPGTSTAVTNVLRSPGGALNRKTATSGESAHKHDVTIAAKNATNAHNNMQPSAVVNFIICTGKTS